MKGGRARTIGEKRREGRPLPGLRVFFLARSKKNGPKTLSAVAPATQAIERATKIFILNTYMVITLSISGWFYWKLDF